MTVSGPSSAATTPTLPSSATTPVDTSPDQLGFLDMIGRAAIHSGDVAHDISSVVIDYGDGTDNSGFRLRGTGIAATLGTNAAAAGLIALRNGAALPAGAERSVGAVLADSGNQFMVNGIRVTPTLISAVVGPALADGVSYVAPNLIPKYKQGMKPSEKSNVQIRRAIAAAGAIGVAAAVTFLIKPDLFKRAGFFSELARNGGEVALDGVAPSLVSKLEAAGGALGKLRLAEDGTVFKMLEATAKDGVFANRMTFGLVGGLGTAWLGYKMTEAKPEDRWKWGAAALAAGTLTAGGIALAPQLTKGATEASAHAFLPSEGIIHFRKPNSQWVKEFASRVVPITAAPGATAAYNYLDVFNDFGQITGPRSPFKGK